MDKRIAIVSGAAFTGVLAAGFVAQAAGIPERGEGDPGAGGDTFAADTRATVSSELVVSGLRREQAMASPSSNARDDHRDGDHQERERGRDHDEDDDDDHEERGGRRGHGEDDD